MVTWLPYTEMTSFYHDFKIAEHPQITMGWDKKDFFFPTIMFKVILNLSFMIKKEIM